MKVENPKVIKMMFGEFLAVGAFMVEFADTLNQYADKHLNALAEDLNCSVEELEPESPAEMAKKINKYVENELGCKYPFRHTPVINRYARENKDVSGFLYDVAKYIREHMNADELYTESKEVAEKLRDYVNEARYLNGKKESCEVTKTDNGFSFSLIRPIGQAAPPKIIVTKPKNSDEPTIICMRQNDPHMYVGYQICVFTDKNSDGSLINPSFSIVNSTGDVSQRDYNKASNGHPNPTLTDTKYQQLTGSDSYLIFDQRRELLHAYDFSGGVVVPFVKNGEIETYRTTSVKRDADALVTKPVDDINKAKEHVAKIIGCLGTSLELFLRDGLNLLGSRNFDHANHPLAGVEYKNGVSIFAELSNMKHSQHTVVEIPEEKPVEEVIASQLQSAEDASQAETSVVLAEADQTANQAQAAESSVTEAAQTAEQDQAAESSVTEEAQTARQDQAAKLPVVEPTDFTAPFRPTVHRPL